jgi:lipopolysaccharide transport system permease protein
VVALVDFTINFVLMLFVMIASGFLPGRQIALLPLMVLLAVIAGLGPALLIAALNVKYRDFRYIVPFLLQFGLYVSPVGFSSDIVPSNWRLLYSLNPVVGIIDGFRWCMLGGESQLYLPGFVASCGVAIIFAWLGIRYFRKFEKTFADVI